MSEILINAAKEGDESVVKQQLQIWGASGHLKVKEDGRTALSWAAGNGHAAVVKQLLDDGRATVNSRDNDSNTPLLWAARNNHHEVVRLLLDHNSIQANSRNNDQVTPLLEAVLMGHERPVRLLLEHNGINVHPKSKGGITPLSCAVENGYCNVVRLLLENSGIIVNLKGKDYYMLLSTAAEKGYEKVVKLLLENNRIEANPKDKDGFTPLSRAVAGGYEKVVKVLLTNSRVQVTSENINDQTLLLQAAENGFDKVVKLLLEDDRIEANPKDKDGRTPLSMAVAGGYEKVVKLLLTNSRVQVTTENIDDQTLLLQAAENGHDKVVKLLLGDDRIEANPKDKDDCTPLSRAVARGYERVVRLLLTNSHVDVNYENVGGRTPLSLAAEMGQYNVVTLLLEQSCVHKDSKDKGGRTPLSWAAAQFDWKQNYLIEGMPKQHHSRYNKVVKLLLGGDGIDPQSKDNSGRTPLSWAAEGGLMEVVMLLLESQAHPDSKDIDGHTPLSWAVSHNLDNLSKHRLERSKDELEYWRTTREAIVTRLLSEYAVDANSKDNNGCTPLLLAAQGGDKAMVLLMLAETRVKPDLKDKCGRTPLSWAAERGHDEVINLLLGNNRVDPDSRDKDGRTPLSWAAENGHDVVVNLLLGKGASPDILDRSIKTPLLWAAEKHHDRVISILLRRDNATLHLLFKEGNESLVDLLLGTGCNVSDLDRGRTLLQSAVQGKNSNLILKVLEYKPHMKGIMAEEWLDALNNGNQATIHVSRGVSGVKRVLFPVSDDVLNELDYAESHLFIYARGTLFREPPIIKADAVLRISLPLEFNADSVEVSISLCFPDDLYSFQGQDSIFDSEQHSIPNSQKFVLKWKIMRPPNPHRDPWIPAVYWSTLPYGWMPDDGMDFFFHFILQLEAQWHKLCRLAEERQAEQRLNQLISEWERPQLLHQLGEASRAWTEYRKTLNAQVTKAREFIANYCKLYNANRTSKELEELIDRVECSVNDRIDKLDQTLEKLLQIEFALVSISETRISTRLGQNVMLLTYVSIFYLPVAFCAAIWAIPDITDSNTRNPFIITSTLISMITLLLAFNVGNIAEAYQRQRGKVLEEMRKDSHWEAKGKKFEALNATQRTPSEWWLLVYLVSKFMGHVTGEKQGN